MAAWHQRLTAGGRRGWIVLPPGAGKTLVGVEAVRASGRQGVVFAPNTAIQAQWCAASPGLRCLTYQALAVFDPDADDELESVVSRLHPNGLALIEELAASDSLMIVLDECHHLLRTWGRLLAEVLERLPDALVLGLTATPAASMTAAEAELEAELFGTITYAATIPEVVVAGDLAPFAELAWLTSPTPTEQDWLGRHEVRVNEFITHLTGPDLASVPLLASIDGLTGAAWADVERVRPRLADAVLRLHHAGLAGLPDAAVLRERHRRQPDLADWVEVLNHWLRPLAGSADPRDEALIAELAALLPSLGLRWTRRGIVAGTPTVDRILARSAAKAQAAVDLVTVEADTLGAGLRALVLCDFERVSAVPRSLGDVVDPGAGSARQVLRELLADRRTRELRPVLVTASTLAGAPDTLRDVARLADLQRGIRGLSVEDDAGIARLTGWGPRQWVPVVTAMLEDGDTNVLVGTRGLLGEGWDARSVNCLIDLTAATTPGAVVQMRGRALRIDPRQPGKVSVAWSVVCITDGLLGGADWARLVRKHEGYVGPDAAGSMVDGIGHLDDSLSAHQPPGLDRIHELNARAILRSQRRADIAEAWAQTRDAGARLRSVVRARRAATQPEPVPLGLTPPVPVRRRREVALPVLTGLAILLAGLGQFWLAAAVVGAALAAFGVRLGSTSRALRGLAEPPSVLSVAAAVADAMHAAGLVDAGSTQVSAELVGEEIRCFIAGVDAGQSALYAEALDEALQPVADPRYVVSRHVVTAVNATTLMRAAWTGRLADAQTWHPVPSALGRRRRDAEAYHRAWNRWVGEGELLYTRSPEGEGVLAAVRGEDPWRLSTAIRLHWG
ncbi:MAG: DEAD/DEAH box helicase family protein [Propionibacteriaceae bacterium]|nr:DEAD/DEAH box helicase family protein [Propionibacteriaceae bacterium]